MPEHSTPLPLRVGISDGRLDFLLCSVANIPVGMSADDLQDVEVAIVPTVLHHLNHLTGRLRIPRTHGIIEDGKGS